MPHYTNVLNLSNILAFALEKYQIETILCFRWFSEHSTKRKLGLIYAKIFKIEKKWPIWRVKSWVLEHLNKNKTLLSLLDIILLLVLQCLKMKKREMIFTNFISKSHCAVLKPFDDA